MSRWLKLLVVLALCAPWLVAALLWPELPERIPTHFNLAGQPDDWSDRSASFWLMFPVLATGFGALIGLVLPWWLVRLARTNSVWLNMPAGFRELPEDARVRATLAQGRWGVMLAIELQLLFVCSLYETHAVATGRQETLSMLVWLLLGGFFVIGIAAAVHSSRALKKTLEGARAANASA
jgi:uncharacterized membrane protein